MKIEGKFWFSEALNHIGIVAGVDERTGEQKAYIGVVGGRDEEQDTERIARQGGKIAPSQIAELNDYLQGKKDLSDEHE